MVARLRHFPGSARSAPRLGLEGLVAWREQKAGLCTPGGGTRIDHVSGASMLLHRSLKQPARAGSRAASRPKTSGLSRRSVAAFVFALGTLPAAAQPQRAPDPPRSIDIVA